MSSLNSQAADNLSAFCWPNDERSLVKDLPVLPKETKIYIPDDDQRNVVPCGPLIATEIQSLKHHSSQWHINRLKA